LRLGVKVFIDLAEDIFSQRREAAKGELPKERKAAGNTVPATIHKHLITHERRDEKEHSSWKNTFINLEAARPTATVP
jgi:hypothetical protein